MRPPPTLVAAEGYPLFAADAEEVSALPAGVGLIVIEACLAAAAIFQAAKAHRRDARRVRHADIFCAGEMNRDYCGK